jgi:hypothetical protein
MWWDRVGHNCCFQLTEYPSELLERSGPTETAGIYEHALDRRDRIHDLAILSILQMTWDRPRWKPRSC